tara:strand:+ start:250 stop:969 length:720 start_codon:yes stop_codon:yes gene_type:complete
MTVFRPSEPGDQEWISIADLMSGLMLVFLAIAVFFMVQIEQDQEEIRKPAVLYDSLQTGLFEKLQSEFSGDFENWNAELDPTTLAFRFREEEVLFEPGRDELSEEFRNILTDFFPRYVDVLMGDSYRDHIEEVRIEGHTSSDWKRLEGLEAYEENMRLSHERTLSVLSFVVRLPGLENTWDSWLRPRLTANGLSSSQLVRVGGVENREQSRRVEFRVRTDAEEQIRLILDRMEESRGTP